MRKALVVAALATVAVAAGAATRPNWNSYVVETEGGGHRLGNPAAKVPVIEFVSYTCSHCAHFEKESDGPLRLSYIAPGKASFEVRPFIRNPVDLAATLLAECGPKEKFFANHTAILRSQDQWLKRISETTAATQARWRTGSMPERMRAVAGDAGFYEIMARRGYDRVATNKCLADEAVARRIAAQSKADADSFGIEGTPSFAIGGKLLDNVHTWETLQQAIDSRQ